MTDANEDSKDVLEVEVLPYPSIDLNDNLLEKAQNFLKGVEEREPRETEQHVATIKPTDNPWGSEPLIELRWHDFDGREDVSFTNHLDSLFQHHDGICADGTIVFAFLECIRAHLKNPHPTLVNNYEVWM